MLRTILEPERAEIIEGWRKICNEALRNMNSSAVITRMINSRRMKLAEHVARIAYKMNAYRILVGKPEGKRQLDGPRNRWEDNFKLVLKK
jgi:hypothetical protein